MRSTPTTPVRRSTRYTPTWSATGPSSQTRRSSTDSSTASSNTTRQEVTTAMAIAERTATTSWDGDLAHGKGTVTGASGGLGDLPVTWASRTERSEGKTSPEELIAAAHAACFSMALSHELTEAGNPPERLEVSAKVTLDERDGAPTVTSSELTVT